MLKLSRSCHLLFCCALLWASAAGAREQPPVDCPLRDAPFSVDSPLIDVLLSPAARAAVDAQTPQMLQDLPQRLLNTDTPSFAAIMTLRSLAGLRRLPSGELDSLNAALGTVQVTDADRRARCARYDRDLPALEVPDADVHLLVFTKINGFDHGPSVGAATDAIKSLAQAMGWAVTVTDRGGAFTPEILTQFDAVVWNNVSGDVLTLSQRRAFEDYIAGGGGFVGIHGAGGDPVYFWDWYADTLLGARFIGHPMNPQFQDAIIQVEKTPSGIGSSLAPGWTLRDEWYSFAASPRSNGADVIATLDESSYRPEGMGGQDLRMGGDHPIAWTRRIGAGRMFYTAIGHRPEVYADTANLALLRDGLRWAARGSR